MNVQGRKCWSFFEATVDVATFYQAVGWTSAEPVRTIKMSDTIMFVFHALYSHRYYRLRKWDWKLLT